jgi:hypothetical protein
MPAAGRKARPGAARRWVRGRPTRGGRAGMRRRRGLTARLRNSRFRRDRVASGKGPLRAPGELQPPGFSRKAPCLTERRPESDGG